MSQEDHEVDKEQESKSSKSWLQTLKEESWEAELLISTVAIFGTLQLFDLVSWMVDWFVDMLAPSQYYFGYIVSFLGLMAIGILTTMFIIHFLMRAYWVGLVGLNSVFPDYSLKDSAYSEIYTNKMLSIIPKLRDTIPKIDDLCSVIFSAAFFLFVMYGYFTIISVVLLLVYVHFGDMIPTFIGLILKWTLIAVVLFQIVISIVANLKKYKSHEPIQNTYFVFIKWSYMLMMGPLYKPLIQIYMSFATNFKKQKSLIGMVVTFLIVGFFISLTQFRTSNMPYLIRTDTAYHESKVYNRAYRSLASNSDFLLGPQIEEEIITSPVLKVFIPVYSYESKIVDKMYGDIEIDGSVFEDEILTKKRLFYLERYQQYHDLKIDGVKISTAFKRYTQVESRQFGIVAYLDIESLGKGEHILSVEKKLGEESKSWEIPFHYFAKK